MTTQQKLEGEKGKQRTKRKMDGLKYFFKELHHL